MPWSYITFYGVKSASSALSLHHGTPKALTLILAVRYRIYWPHVLTAHQESSPAFPELIFTSALQQGPCYPHVTDLYIP